MSCYTELTYSVYADGELPAVETLAVERHLESCAACRRLVAGLRAENQVLRTALAEPGYSAAEVPAWSPASPSPGAAGPLLAVVAALAGLRVTLGFLFDLQLPTGLDSAVEWFNPFHLNTQLEMFFRSVFFVAEEGASMFVFMISIVSVLVLLVLGVFASLLLRRQGAQVSTGLLASLALVVVLGAPPQAAAVEVRRVQGRLETITIPAGQTINDSLIAAADTVTVDGVIAGNLIAAGRRVVVRGTVQGDLVAVAQEVDVEGTVTGNVFIVAQWNNVRGKVQGTVYAFSQAFRLDSSSSVAGDLLAFGASAQVEGSVVRDVMAFGSVTDVRGKIGRNLSVFGDRVLLAAASTVGGDFLAKVPSQLVVTVDPGAKISGKQDVQIVTRRSVGMNRFSDSRFYFWQGVQLVGALIFGALLLLLFPGFYKSAAAEVGSWPRNLGLGFAVFFAGPVAMCIIGVTLIGLPVAFATLFLYLTGLYLAKIFAGAWLGQMLLRRPEPTNADSLLALAIGLVILFIAMQIPFVGGIFHLVIFCLGLGVFTWRLHAGMRTA